jgi:hypothetical protein
MNVSKYEPLHPPIGTFITRFFLEDKLLFSQETTSPIPTMIAGDTISIFDTDYYIKKRDFGFNEDAFITVYYIAKE